MYRRDTAHNQRAAADHVRLRICGVDGRYPSSRRSLLSGATPRYRTVLSIFEPGENRCPGLTQSFEPVNEYTKNSLTSSLATTGPITPRYCSSSYRGKLSARRSLPKDDAQAEFNCARSRSSASGNGLPANQFDISPASLPGSFPVVSTSKSYCIDLWIQST